MKRHATRLLGLRRRWWVAGAVVTITLLGGGAALASGDDSGSDQPITGLAYQRAVDAALAETGGGRVTETEDGDEESRYEVEVTLDNGTQVDVQLDDQFRVVGSKADRESE